MDKIKSLILMIVILVVNLSMIASAEEEKSLPMMKNFDIEIIDIDEEELFVMPFSLEQKSIEEHIFDECKEHSEQIGLVGYNVTLDELSDLISANSEFMIYAGGFTAAVYVQTGFVAYFYPRYLFDSVETDEQARKLMDEKIQYYADYAKNQSDDALERLLLAHDKLIHDVYYDFDYESLSFHAYGMLINGKGVCQAYAEIIYMLAKEFGIEAWFCSSKANGEIDINGVPQIVGHIWNYIKIDGEWYHLDATWNDPDANSDYAGIYTSAAHSYFLVSDNKMEDHKTEYEWIITLDGKPSCDSEKYEKNHFFNIIHICEITAGDGYLQTTFTVNPIGNIVLRTYDGLYTGPVISSTVTETSSAYTLYYYFLEDFDKFNVLVSAKDGDKILTAKQYTRIPASGTYPQYSFGGISVSKTLFPQEQGLELFTWDTETLRPLSSKIQLN